MDCIKKLKEEMETRKDIMHILKKEERTVEQANSPKDSEKENMGYEEKDNKSVKERSKILQKMIGSMRKERNLLHTQRCLNTGGGRTRIRLVQRKLLGVSGLVSKTISRD